MDRRKVLVFGSGAAFVVAAGALLPRSNSTKTVVYLGARDCPPCIKFEKFYKDSYRQWLAQDKIGFRQVVVDTLRDNRQISAWPEDLRWLREKLWSEIGTPWFFLIQDHQIIRETQYPA